MFGDQYSDGLLISSIAYILETHNSSISVSVTEIIGSDCYDLTSGKKIECNVNLAKTTKLSSLSHFGHKSPHYSIAKVDNTEQDIIAFTSVISIQR